MKNKNCKVIISGTVVEECVFSHVFQGERFYILKISCERKSGVLDNVPIMVSDRFDPDIECLNEGTNIVVYGDFRSHNLRTGESSKLLLYVFAEEIEIVEEKVSKNEINIDGYICKEPKYRTTPLGREICDLLIAVNSNYRKTYYIPCICWGRNAKYASKLKVGRRIIGNGRIQSRIYKKTYDEVTEEKEAYEVSLITILEEDDNHENFN